MNILITGGAGFIGSAVIKYIIGNTKNNVINLDKLTYAGNLESLTNIHNSEQYVFEHGDICDRATVERIFRKYQPDAIMHLAAESHVDRSINGPDEFIKTNILGTYQLLETSRNYWNNLDENKKSNFRFHHISTDEVFGDLENLDTYFTENSPYDPSSPYSASKASSDHLVRAWQRSYNLPTIITNCSNNYGPFQFPEKLIPLMILNAKNGKQLPIYGKGDQIRDWLYVDDHAQALYLVLKKSRISETYNIGGHNEKNNLEVVNTICELLEELAPNKPNGVSFYKDLITFVDDRPGHDYRYAIDANKICNDLEWHPKETFESGLRKTVSWYINNDQWVNHISSGEYRDWLNKHYNE